MMKLLYLPLGLVLLVCDCIGGIYRRGDIGWSNYQFNRRLNKNLKNLE